MVLKPLPRIAHQGRAFQIEWPSALSPIEDLGPLIWVLCGSLKCGVHRAPLSHWGGRPWRDPCVGFAGRLHSYLSPQRSAFRVMKAGDQPMWGLYPNQIQGHPQPQFSGDLGSAGQCGHCQGKPGVDDCHPGQQQGRRRSQVT